MGRGNTAAEAKPEKKGGGCGKSKQGLGEGGDRRWLRRSESVGRRDKCESEATLGAMAEREGGVQLRALVMGT